MAILTRILAAIGTALSRRNKWKHINALYREAQQYIVRGEHGRAAELLERALRLDPSNVILLNELGSELITLGKQVEAHVCFDQAVKVDDCFAPAVVNLATILATSAQRTGQAAVLAHRALKLTPEDGRVDAILAQVALKQGETSKASNHALRGWLKSFDDDELASSYLFALGHSPHCTDEVLASEHMFWGATRRRSQSSINETLRRSPPPHAKKKLRLGYVSGDLRQHSVAYFLLPVLDRHDLDKFEIYLYHTNLGHDTITDRLRERAYAYRPLGDKAPSEVRDAIRADQLDILIELSGHTSQTGLHAINGKLALLQVSAFGYPPTTGSRWIDFKLVDRQLVPAGHANFYSEEPLALKGSFWTFRPLDPTPAPAPPERLKRSHVAFGYFGSVAKVNDEVLTAWSRVLARVPKSRLLIKSVFFIDPACRDGFLNRCLQQGIPGDRLDLLQPDAASALYAAYDAVDIILDTYPFNGGTTTCFALWMGVPVITRAGHSVISRMGASMLQQLGEPTLISDSWDDYVDAATALAADNKRRLLLRVELRQRMLACSLGNADLFVPEYEASLEEAWRRVTQAPPEPDSRYDLKQTMPLQELMQRVNLLISTGQISPARRVLAYASDQYPQDPSTVLMGAMLLRAEGKLQAARELLESCWHARADVLCNEAGVMLAECCLELGEHSKAAEIAEAMRLLVLPTMLAMRVKLVELATADFHRNDTFSLHFDESEPADISVVVHCPDDHQFEHIAANVRQVLGEFVDLVRSSSQRKAVSLTAAIESCRSSTVLLLHKDCRLLSIAGIRLALKHLEGIELLGSVGARSLEKVHWTGHPLADTVGARMHPHRQNDQDGWLLKVFGGLQQNLIDRIRILSDDVLIFRKSLIRDYPLNPQLDGPHSLMEIEWSARVARISKRVRVAPSLACVRAEQDSDRQRWSKAGALADHERLFGELIECQRIVDDLAPAVAIGSRDANKLYRMVLAVFAGGNQGL